MAERRLSLQESLRIGLAVAVARGAHGHGVLHRDLKPGNVRIGLDGRVRVLDFGLAKFLPGRSEAPSAATRVTDCPPPLPSAGMAGVERYGSEPTEDGAALGTPPYMAPEQWAGEQCTEATDVWALGIIMHELLVGRRPYEAESAEALGFKVVCEQAVPRIDLPEEAPAELGDLLAAMLRKSGAERPSAAAVTEQLERMLYPGRGHAGEDLSPFRGLMPFSERHAELFFGRRSEIVAFLERLREEPVLPVVGPSGAGKSSFVQAGVIPRLRERGHWTVLQLRPGRDPFRNLAARLVRQETRSRLSASAAATPATRPAGRPLGPSDAPDLRSADTSEPAPASEAVVEPERAEQAAGRAPESARAFDASARLAEQLLEAPYLLSVLLRKLAEKDNTKVLLVVDQLEELYTLVQDERVRRLFMQAVCTAADDRQDPVTSDPDVARRLSRSTGRGGGSARRVRPRHGSAHTGSGGSA